MNSPELPSARAAARSPMRSASSGRTGPGTPAAARQAARPKAASRNRLRFTSGAIARIDLDIALGEIAGPETCLARARAFDEEAYVHLPGVQFLLQLALDEIRGQAGLADQHVLHADIDLAR